MVPPTVQVSLVPKPSTLLVAAPVRLRVAPVATVTEVAEPG